MSRLLIEPVTPDEPGYIALKAESIALNFNMLRRLEENWQ
ncbi:GNAT family N-acetyltransferase, partial [Escherichia coli]